MTPYSLQAIESQAGDSPVIDRVRLIFSQAEVPTLDDLNLEQEIFCREYSTISGNIISEGMHFNFSQDKIISGLILNSGKAKVKSFILTESSMSGNFKDRYNYILDIRKGGNGFLLAEWATLHPKGRRYELIRSIANDKYYAISYLVCDRG